MTKEEIIEQNAVAAIAAAGCAFAGAKVVEIRPQAFAELVDKVEALNRRAAKLGMEPVRFGQIADRIYYLEKLGVIAAIRKWPVVALFGRAPLIAGWEFVARIEHTSAGNIIAKAPGAYEVDVVAYRGNGPDCDHCGLKRNRADTFLVRNVASGEMKQVGRTCLADFCGTEDAVAAAGIFALMIELDAAGGDGEDWGGGGGGGRCEPTPEFFLACAVVAVRIGGWASSKEDCPTKGFAANLAYPLPGRASDEVRAEWAANQPSEKDIARAQEILAWVAANPDTSDFISNLKVACALSECGHRHQGIVAAAIVAFDREVERRVREKFVAAVGYVGVVGKRGEFGDLVVERTRFVDGMYGTKTIVVARDGAGHVFTWFASGVKDLEAGQILHGVKATVKEHRTHEKFGAETVVQRMTWKDAA